jgi:predicted Na+-dependent transporter
MDLTPDDFRKVRNSPRSFLVGTFGQYLLPLVALIRLKFLEPGQEIMTGMALIASAPGGGTTPTQ